MKSFLKLQSVEEVLAHLRAFPPLPSEDVPLDEALSRFTAAPLAAPHDLPGFDRSTVDGFAVRARDVFGAQEASPALLDIAGDCRMGEAAGLTLEEGRTARILTGGMLPAGADAVVMVEYSRPAGGQLVELTRSVAPGENVLRHDEDAAAGRICLPQGHCLRPQEIGLLAAFGLTHTLVRRRPRVGILSTGDEVVPVTATPAPGQIRDVNAHSLAALCRRCGAAVTQAGLVPDDPAALRAAVTALCATQDVVVVSGGSSAGMRDHTVEVFTAGTGGELLCHGVALSPGKPFILARKGDVCLMGLPGHVSSALICAHVFLRPLLRHLQGAEGDVRPVPGTLAVLSRPLASAQGRRDYIRVRLEALPSDEQPRTADLPPVRWRAIPLTGPSGCISGLTQAGGLVVCPENREGLYGGEVVEVELLDGLS